jgi:hypothetical protein
MVARVVLERKPMSHTPSPFNVLEYILREMSQPSEPPKRRNRQRSGRANIRRYHGQRWVQEVGGTSQQIRATYDGPDSLGDEVRDLCVIVDEVKAVTTFTDPEYKPRGNWHGGHYNHIGRVGSV